MALISLIGFSDFGVFGVFVEHVYWKMQLKLIPTILCGGAGSRLWPVSRELHPKPFIRLADGQSLLQKAWLRGAALPDVAGVLTVTNRELFFKTEDEYRAVAGTRHDKLDNSFILEPFGRNTAPAIAAAALHVAQTHGEDALMLVLAADHLIADQPAFAAAVAQAMQLAAQGKLLASSPMPPKPAMATSRQKATRSFGLLKSPVLKKRRNTWRPAATCGTPASSVFLPAPCCRRWNCTARPS